MRISNITDDGRIDESNLVFLHPAKAAELERTQVQAGDLVVSQRGTLGVPAVVPTTYSRWCISANLIAIKRPALRPDFIQAFIALALGAMQLKRAQSGQVQGKITTADVARLLIPRLENDRRLVTALDIARAARREKLAQADALLAGLDGFVLDALGLTLPPPDGRPVYAVRLRDARQRFDPDYNSPRFRTLRDKIKHGEFPAQSVGSLFYPIVSGFAAGRDDQTDEPALGVPHIRPLNITNNAELTFEGTKMVPRSAVAPGDFLKQGEILYNNTNSTAWVGKSVVFDADRDCACSNHITRLTLIDKRHSPYYFAAFFNALRGLGFFGLLSTNFNNQAGINVETLKAVSVPVPDPKDQQKIAGEVARRRNEARRLRNDARIVWDDAKRRFEEELLGPEPNAEEPKTGVTKGGREQ